MEVAKDDPRLINPSFKFGIDKIIPPEMLLVPTDSDSSGDEDVFYSQCADLGSDSDDEFYTPPASPNNLFQDTDDEIYGSEEFDILFKLVDEEFTKRPSTPASSGLYLFQKKVLVELLTKSILYKFSKNCVF